MSFAVGPFIPDRGTKDPYPDLRLRLNYQYRRHNKENTMVHKTHAYDLKIFNTVLFFSFAIFIVCFADLTRG